MATGKQLAIGITVALACVGIAYGVGRMQTAGKIEDANKRASAAESASAAAASSVRVQLEIEKATVARLEARRRLHQALMALDDRNFGTAQEHLAAAKSWLSGAKGADPELTKLSTDIDALKLVATEDVGEQRTKVLAIVKRLDELVPPAQP
ncbi:MAG: hypothetical protein ACXVEF_18760 [Polyangiales bacterium]